MGKAPVKREAGRSDKNCPHKEKLVGEIERKLDAIDKLKAMLAKAGKASKTR